jgi:uncharacterized membrane protein
MSKKRKASHDEAPSSSRARTILYTIAALIGVAGIAETTYLTAIHLAGAHIACIASTGCSQVLGSRFSVVAGVPLAAIGALGYFAVFGTATLAAFCYRWASTLFALVVGAMFLTTLFLLYAQAFLLHAYCDYCLLSAAMIIGLTAILILLPAQSDRGS